MDAATHREVPSEPLERPLRVACFGESHRLRASNTLNMPISSSPSGLFVYTSQAGSNPKFKCSYSLDERIDSELGQLCWTLLRSIQPYLGDHVNIRVRNHLGAV